jgi:septum formation protein
VTRRFVLASASPSRLRELRAAGLSPEVIVSGVDESTASASDPAALVLELAEQKARAVARGSDALVLGCDSLLDLDGLALGKPADRDVAIRRWQAMRGRHGVLRTGHVLIDASSGAQVSELVSTVVRFGSPSDAELARYVESGEPLSVAGGFTLEGRSAPFIDGIIGDPTNVLGLSLPALRRLLARLGVAITDLWSTPD